MCIYIYIYIFIHIYRCMYIYVFSCYFLWVESVTPMPAPNFRKANGSQTACQWDLRVRLLYMYTKTCRMLFVCRS